MKRTGALYMLHRRIVYVTSETPRICCNELNDLNVTDWFRYVSLVHFLYIHIYIYIYVGLYMVYTSSQLQEPIDSIYMLLTVINNILVKVIMLMSFVVHLRLELRSR